MRQRGSGARLSSRQRVSIRAAPWQSRDTGDGPRGLGWMLSHVREGESTSKEVPVPFTPSHAVLALPFLRTPIPAAAVAVGAMIPDAPLFIPGAPVSYAMTHDLRWLPLTVLLGLAALLVWRMLLRSAATELAPRWVAARLPPEWDTGPVAGARETFRSPGRSRATAASVLLLLAGLTIGILTHIVWDAFTHDGRWGVALAPVLDTTWGAAPGYAWMQRISSVLGLTILAVWAGRWLRRAPTRSLTRRIPQAVRVVWWLSLPVALVAAAAVALLGSGGLTAAFTLTHLVYGVWVPVAAVWALATLVLAAVIAWDGGVARRDEARHARDAP